MNKLEEYDATTGSTVSTPAQGYTSADEEFHGTGVWSKNKSERHVTHLHEEVRARNTAIVGDTLDLQTLAIYEPDGTSLAPSNILLLLDTQEIRYHVWVAVRRAIEEHRCGEIIDHERSQDLIKIAVEGLIVELGTAMLDRVPGPHLTFVDPRYHDDTVALLQAARRLLAIFKKKGVASNRIVINIPATEQGIVASQLLVSEYGVHVNLTYITGLMHAAACVEAGASAISIPIQNLLQWHEKRTFTVCQNLMIHPGIETVQTICAYFETNKIRTRVIGTNFSALSEISMFGGLDAIALSKEQIERLHHYKVPEPRFANMSATATFRAREAQYPTTLLATKSGILNEMSTEARATLAEVMYVALGQMRVEMELLEGVVEAEFSRQLAILTLDLKTIYRPETPNRRKTRKRSKERSMAANPWGEALPRNYMNDMSGTD